MINSSVIYNFIVPICHMHSRKSIIRYKPHNLTNSQLIERDEPSQSNTVFPVCALCAPCAFVPLSHVALLRCLTARIVLPWWACMPGVLRFLNDEYTMGARVSVYKARAFVIITSSIVMYGLLLLSHMLYVIEHCWLRVLPNTSFTSTSSKKRLIAEDRTPSRNSSAIVITYLKSMTIWWTERN